MDSETVADNDSLHKILARSYIIIIDLQQQIKLSLTYIPS